jgi:hypothetical protein
MRIEAINFYDDSTFKRYDGAIGVWRIVDGCLQVMYVAGPQSKFADKSYNKELDRTAPCGIPPIVVQQAQQAKHLHSLQLTAHQAIIGSAPQPPSLAACKSGYWENHHYTLLWEWMYLKMGSAQDHVARMISKQITSPLELS